MRVQALENVYDTATCQYIAKGSVFDYHGEPCAAVAKVPDGTPLCINGVTIGDGPAAAMHAGGTPSNFTMELPTREDVETVAAGVHQADARAAQAAIAQARANVAAAAASPRKK